MTRDSYSFHQAVEILRTNNNVTLSEKEIADLFAELPVRKGRTLARESEVDHLISDHPTPDEHLVNEETRNHLRQASLVLERGLQGLRSEDRFLITLALGDGISVAQIARMLQQDQKKLYRRIYKIHGQLKKVLEQEGIMKDRIAEILS